MWIDQTDYRLQVPSQGLTDTARTALRNVLTSGGTPDYETDDAGILTITICEVQQGSALDYCEEAALILASHGLARPVRVWSTPYETLGTIAYHVPGLGVWDGDCDNDGTPYLPADQALDLADKDDPHLIAWLIHRRLGTAWREAFDSFGDHTPGCEPLTASQQAELARARAATTYTTPGSIPQIAHDYIRAGRDYRAALAAWHAKPDTTPAPWAVTDAQDWLTLIREALRQRGCRLASTIDGDTLIILPIGAAFTAR